MTTAAEIADLILARVEELDWVSFAEVAKMKGASTPPGEGLAIVLKARGRERFLWNNLTKEACDAVQGLMDNHRLTIAPASVLSYVVDGLVPQSKDWIPTALRPAKAANDILGEHEWLYYDRKRGARPSKALLAWRKRTVEPVT